MKKSIAILSILGALTIALAQTVSYDAWFTWTPNPASEMVTGYRIEYQKLPAITNWTYSHFVPAATNRTVVKGLQSGYIYKFRAFAINAVGIGTNQSSIVQIPSTSPTVVSNFVNTPTN